MWHTQPTGATLLSSPSQDDALWQAYARVPDHTPLCTSSSQMPYKSSSSEVLSDSSWPSFIFPSIFAKPLVCFALASPPFPTPYPHPLISKSWPMGATHMALMRPSHIEIHTCKLELYLRGNWMERDDYMHIDTYSFLSLLFSLDCELFEGKDSLSCLGPFLVPMNTNLPNNNPTQIPYLHYLKRNGTNELTCETETDSQT